MISKRKTKNAKKHRKEDEAERRAKGKARALKLKNAREQKEIDRASIEA